MLMDAVRQLAELLLVHQPGRGQTNDMEGASEHDNASHGAESLLSTSWERQWKGPDSTQVLGMMKKTQIPENV